MKLDQENASQKVSAIADGKNRRRRLCPRLGDFRKRQWPVDLSRNRTEGPGSNERVNLASGHKGAGGTTRIKMVRTLLCIILAAGAAASSGRSWNWTGNARGTRSRLSGDGAASKHLPGSGISQQQRQRAETAKCESSQFRQHRRGLYSFVDAGVQFLVAS
jgi:hypothetical protein